MDYENENATRYEGMSTPSRHQDASSGTFRHSTNSVIFSDEAPRYERERERSASPRPTRRNDSPRGGARRSASPNGNADSRSVYLSQHHMTLLTSATVVLQRVIVVLLQMMVLSTQAPIFSSPVSTHVSPSKKSLACSRSMAMSRSARSCLIHTPRSLVALVSSRWLLLSKPMLLRRVSRVRSSRVVL